MTALARRLGALLTLVLVGGFLLASPAAADRVCLKEGLIQQPDGSATYGCIQWSEGAAATPVAVVVAAATPRRRAPTRTSTTTSAWAIAPAS